MEKQDYKDAFIKTLESYRKAKDEHERFIISKKARVLFEKLIKIYGLESYFNNESNAYDKQKAFIDRFLFSLFSGIFENIENTKIADDLSYLMVYKNIVEKIIFKEQATDKEKIENIIIHYKFDENLPVVGYGKINISKLKNVFFVSEAGKIRPLKTPIELTILISWAAKEQLDEIFIAYDPIKISGIPYLEKLFNSYYSLFEKIADTKIMKDKGFHIIKCYPKGYVEGNFIRYSSILSYDIFEEKFFIEKSLESSNKEKEIIVLPSFGYLRRAFFQVLNMIIEKNRYDYRLFDSLIKEVSISDKKISRAFKIWSKKVETLIYNPNLRDKIEKYIKEKLPKDEGKKEAFLMFGILYGLSLVSETRYKNKNVFERAFDFVEICYEELKGLYESESKNKSKNKNNEIFENIESVIKKMIDIYAEKELDICLITLAKDKNLPNNLRELAGIKAAIIYKDKGLYNHLIDLENDEKVCEIVKIVAKNLLNESILKRIEISYKNNDFWSLIRIKNDKRINEELRNLADEKIKEVAINYIEKCCDEGNYEPLIAISRNEFLDEKIRDYAHQSIDKAVKKAIDISIKHRYFMRLINITCDERLSIDLRGKAGLEALKLINEDKNNLWVNELFYNPKVPQIVKEQAKNMIGY